MTRSMVCEGRCSPLTGEFDRAAARYREAYNRAVKSSTAIDPDLGLAVRALARRLVHTAHVAGRAATGREAWVCRGCGAVRV